MAKLYRVVQETTVYGQGTTRQVFHEGVCLAELCRVYPRRGLNLGFICSDFETTPAWFEELEPDGTFKRCEDPRPRLAPDSNRKRR